MFQCMKQESNDIKQLVTQVVTYVAKSMDQPLDGTLIKSFTPMLVMGTKEKNTVVRSHSESALIALLRLRHGEDTLKVQTRFVDRIKGICLFWTS